MTTQGHVNLLELEVLLSSLSAVKHSIVSAVREISNYFYVCPQYEIHYRQASHGHTVSTLPLIKSETNIWGVSWCRVEFISWGVYHVVFCPAGFCHTLFRLSIHPCLQPLQLFVWYTQQPTQPLIHLSKYKLVIQKSTQPLTTHPLIDLPTHTYHSIQPPNQKNHSLRQLHTLV